MERTCWYNCSCDNCNMKAITQETHLAIWFETSKISIFYLKEHRPPIEYQDFWGINVIPTKNCKMFWNSMGATALMHCSSCNITPWKLLMIQKLMLLDSMQWISKVFDNGRHFLLTLSRPWVPIDTFRFYSV